MCVTSRHRFSTFVHELQNTILTALEQLDGGARFRVDTWERPGGGGGRTCILSSGRLFEKAGVNTSIVYGLPPADLLRHIDVGGTHVQFWAAGLSMVVHPVSPMVPTYHANVRYFELTDANGTILDAWFGGGIDLTPYYIVESDIIAFHTVLRDACESRCDGSYNVFKAECDSYFVNTHRMQEPRGVGGVFFDHLRNDVMGRSLEDWQAFTVAIGHAILPAYMPIAERQRDTPYSERHVWWQEIRRGRYVEFNLIHDRGTLFGLQTNGRTESILMSLPPRARWEYDVRVEPDSDEARLLSALTPRDWLAYESE